jgi:two-component system, OmpR family, response regulator RegX3
LRIALLEDDVEQATWIAQLLDASGHNVTRFERGRALVRRASSESYDLLILDWELPDISGLEVLRTIREQMDTTTPVLFVTHRDSESDIVDALEAGADDYLVKPPRERELLSRVNALGRRSRDPKVEVLEAGPYRIDFKQRAILRAGQTVELTRREFDVAAMLFRNLGKVVSRAHLLVSVWGNHDGSTTRTVDTHVSRVRMALGLSTSSGVRLVTVYGYGYRLELVQQERS